MLLRLYELLTGQCLGATTAGSSWVATGKTPCGLRSPFGSSSKEISCLRGLMMVDVSWCFHIPRFLAAELAGSVKSEVAIIHASARRPPAKASLLSACISLRKWMQTARISDDQLLPLATNKGCPPTRPQLNLAALQEPVWVRGGGCGLRKKWWIYIYIDKF